MNLGRAQKPFYMLRHGESVANAERFVAGSLNVALTDKGRKQAEIASRCLLALQQKPTEIIHSSLLRAAETAQIINKVARLPLSENSGLNERCYGEWQNLPLDEMRKLRLSGMEPPRGENTDVFDKRINQTVCSLLEHTRGLPLFIGHAGTFDGLFRSHKSKIDLAENCTVYGFFPPSTSQAFPWLVKKFFFDEKEELVSEVVTVRTIYPPSLPALPPRVAGDAGFGEGGAEA